VLFADRDEQAVEVVAADMRSTGPRTTPRSPST
jgi:hypothetical protein